ncbi:MAG: hypothetical protein WC956_09235 [bacterium]
MEYTSKHKKLLAELLRKADKKKEAEKILSDNEYRFEISEAIRNARSIVGIEANDDVLLDALRRYENRDCPIFKECPFPRCKGAVWCDVYNLGGSHSSVGSKYRHLGAHVTDIPKKMKKEIMLEMIKRDQG